jgi:hypothetical protein
MTSQEGLISIDFVMVDFSKGVFRVSQRYI